MIYLVGADNSNDLVPFTAPLTHGQRINDPGQGPTARWAAQAFPNQYFLKCHNIIVYSTTQKGHATRVQIEFNNLVRWGVIPDGAMVNLWKLAERMNADRQMAVSKKPDDALEEFPPLDFRLAPYEE